MTSSPDTRRPSPMDGRADAAEAEFRRDPSWNRDPPQNPAALFARLRVRSVGAGIAEGRGGFPGGRAAPDWTDYVALQRRHLAIYDALARRSARPGAKGQKPPCAS